MKLTHQFEQEALKSESERQKASKHDAHVHRLEAGAGCTVALMIISVLIWSIWELVALPADDRRREISTLMVHLIIGASLPLAAGGLWTKWKDRG